MTELTGHERLSGEEPTPAAGTMEVAAHDRVSRPPSSVQPENPPGGPGGPPGTLTVGIGVFGLYHLALAAFMAVAPHSFYTHVGPFGPPNDHYVRDVASYNAAIGVAFLLALRRPSWRVPVLALTMVQFGLHSLNHLIDIDRAHPAWNGYFDFFSLAALTLLLAWLLRVAVAEAGASRPSSKGAFQ